MINKMILITAIALTSTAVSAADVIFTSLDADKNGAVSKTEAAKMPQLIDQWKALDLDGNNELNVEEFNKYKAS